MQPGYQQYPQQPPMQPINNNMTMSIVAIFFFWPLAIPAIIAASKVNPALQMGDFAGAQQFAADSRRWSKLALIIGIVVWVVVIVCYVVAFGALFATSTTLNNP